MRNTLISILFLVMALGMSVNAFADAYTIGTGTSTESYIPFYGMYDYGWSKTIYTAAEMQAAGMPATGTAITGISYYVGNTPNNYVAVDQRVYVRNTSATAIDLTYIADPLAEASPFTLAFQGDYTWNGGGWHNVLFTAPFAWNGTDNIEILWQNWDGDYASGPNFRYTTTTPTYLACYKYADNAMPVVNGTNYYYRPNLRFLDASVSAPGAPGLIAPADLATNVSQSPAFSWSAPTTGGIPTTYKLYLNEGSPTFTTTLFEGPVTSFPYPGVLNYSAVYYWKVAASNTAGDTDSPVFSFTTMADPTVNPDYFVDFGTLSTDWPVQNWTQLTGLYGSPLIAGAQWFQDDWLNVADPINKAAKINIYGTTRKGWLISPPVNIPATGDYQIKFDACLVDWNGTIPPEVPIPDDRFLVVMGDNPNMANPVILGEWNNTGSPLVLDAIPATGATYTLPITASGIKYFAFYGESTESNGDNDLMIDNLSIQARPIIDMVNPPAGVTVVPGGDNGMPGTDTGQAALVYTITATGVWDVKVWRLSHYPPWYVYINNAQYTAGPIMADYYIFENVDFDAIRGSLVITIDDNADQTLPVELSSFTGTMTAEYFVQLNWTTQSESNLIGYRVMRSEGTDVAQAINMTPVLIDAYNESTTHNYSFTDTEVENNMLYNYWLESVEMDGTSQYHGPVSVSVEHEVPPVVPTQTTMRSAYPNPFNVNGNTTIEVAVKEGDAGNVTIYNILGQVVKTYTVNPGNNNLTWNGKDFRGNSCGSGIYFYRLSTPSMNKTMKMVIVK